MNRQSKLLLKIFALLLVIYLAAFNLGAALASAATNEMEAGVAAYNQHNYADCVAYLQKVTAKEPTNVNAHYYLGCALSNLGNRLAAMHEYKLCVELSPESQVGNYAEMALGMPILKNTKGISIDRNVQSVNNVPTINNGQTIDGTTIIRPSGDGIRINQSNDNRISNATILQAGGNGISIINGAGNTVRGSVIIGSRGDGINITGSSGNVIGGQGAVVDRLSGNLSSKNVQYNYSPNYNSRNEPETPQRAVPGVLGGYRDRSEQSYSRSVLGKLKNSDQQNYSTAVHGKIINNGSQ